MNNTKKGDAFRHPRNRYTGKYDFARLIRGYPELARFVRKNPSRESTIDFADPAAVKALNRALLKDFYGIERWDIPPGYLCPPIPGRSDYIHTIADLLALSNQGPIPEGSAIHALDVGVGANCIYPIIGNREYGWTFVGTDTDAVALGSAQSIIDANPELGKAIELRQQESPSDILYGMFRENEVFDLSVCNPPFHASLEDAQAGSQRKWRNLGREPVHSLNFGGQNSELWCPGGELAFVRHMIQESAELADCCFWFSALISKEDHLVPLYTTLKNSGVTDYRTLAMAQGQKKTRIIAWTFLTPRQREEWRNERWTKTELGRSK
jgi:23S rRNA (adenine1618-N6)-methyltransferase